MKHTQKKYIFGLGVALAALILFVGVVHQAGYVLAWPYIVKGGTVVVEDARPLSDVFIDNRRAGRVSREGVGVFDGIKPGTRSIIVAHGGSWPWIFEFEGVSNKTVTLHPLQAFEETTVVPLLSVDDPVRMRADEQLREYREPTQSAPLEREGVRAWVSGTSILVRDSNGPRTIFTSPNPVRSIHWYGERNDAIIASVNNNVFALDIRESQVQNFQPIYTGSTPTSVADPIRPESIFVEDRSQVFSISI